MSRLLTPQRRGCTAEHDSHARQLRPTGWLPMSADMTSRTWQLPRGARLSDESWAARHRVITLLLWLHVPALMLVGLLGPRPVWEAVGLPLVVAAFGAGAAVSRSRRWQAGLTSVGLITTTFVAIELTGGAMASHIHLYAILIFIALYQQWSPLLAAVAVIVVHHGLLGLVAPERVFGMPMSTTSALFMVGVHAGLALLEVSGIIVFWHFAEVAEHEVETIAAQIEQDKERSLLAEQQARQQAAADELGRTRRLAERAERISHDVAVLSEGAHAAINAVAAVDAELATLSSAVRSIAERSNQAASTASTGQATAQASAEKIQQLERSVGEIASVNALIAQLAGQTNLLSLNATIEAARAGEMGRGFAVVASEVKELANETSQSAKKINEVIDSITDETSEVASSFVSTTSVIDDIHNLQIDIAASVEEQSSVLAEVTRQLSTATDAAKDMLRNLDQLAQTATHE